MNIAAENYIKLMKEECDKLKFAYESGQISFYTYWIEIQNIISFINRRKIIWNGSIAYQNHLEQ